MSSDSPEVVGASLRSISNVSKTESNFAGVGNEGDTISPALDNEGTWISRYHDSCSNSDVMPWCGGCWCNESDFHQLRELSVPPPTRNATSFFIGSSSSLNTGKGSDLESSLKSLFLLNWNVWHIVILDLRIYTPFLQIGNLIIGDFGASKPYVATASRSKSVNASRKQAENNDNDDLKDKDKVWKMMENVSCVFLLLPIFTILSVSAIVK